MIQWITTIPWRRRMVRLALLLVVTASAPAWGDDLRERARQEFAEGRRQFDAGAYEVALEHLQRAYALAPYPALLFNIARCFEELGRVGAAVDAYERYLAVQSEDHSARERLAALRRQLATGTAPPPSETQPSPGLHEPPANASPPPTNANASPSANGNASANGNSNASANGNSNASANGNSNASANGNSNASANGNSSVNATTSAALANSLAATPAKPHARRRWWVWASIAGAVAVAGVAVGLGVGLTRPSAPPSFPPLAAH
jgi:tetratricopeptide (TPR) repeat protein